MTVAATLILLNAHVVDADGARDVPAIVVQEGHITAMGDAPPDMSDAEVLDLAGSTVMPGLVDAHVHLSLDPSGAWRDDTAEDVAAFRATYLRSYLAWGVTTVLDTAIRPDDYRALLAIAEQVPSPNLHTLGPVISPQDGYVNAVLPAFPGTSSPADVGPQFVEWDDLNPDGVKLTEEVGMAGPIWPLHNDDVRAEIRAQASSRGWPLYVHAQNAQEHLDALASYEPHAVVHSLDKPSKKVVRAYAATHTYMVTTMAIIDVNLCEFEPERLDDPMLALTVPAAQLESARDPEVGDKYRRFVTATVLPDASPWMQNVAVNAVGSRGPLDRRLRKNQKAILQLHEAGVPMVLGSDSGNWPVFPYEFHGPTTLRELELLVDGGLTPLEAITAGTLTAARMLGVEEDQGRVAVGQRADLRVVDGDPLADITAARNIQWVIKDGEARTPRGWMEGGPLR